MQQLSRHFFSIEIFEWWLKRGYGQWSIFVRRFGEMFVLILRVNYTEIAQIANHIPHLWNLCINYFKNIDIPFFSFSLY